MTLLFVCSFCLLSEHDVFLQFYFDHNSLFALLFKIQYKPYPVRYQAKNEFDFLSQ